VSDADVQLDLFAAPPPAPDRRLSVRLEREHAECAAIAARLPPRIFFGTSSWSFPEWAGLVYSRRPSSSVLAREGLAEYARHPLLTTVGIDRGFYAPIPARDLEDYARQLPTRFLCLAKAPAAVTDVVVREGSIRRANPDYLNPSRFGEEMLDPFRAVFREHSGPFVLQFPPAPPGAGPAPEKFVQALDRFLEKLPRDFHYAVELREARLLTSEYREVLLRHGVSHVYNLATAMPLLAEQAEAVPAAAAFVVIRLLLPPSTRYEERRAALAPFDRIRDPDLEMRRQVAGLARRAAENGREVFILVNNKAEGCAPATIRALAELLTEETSDLQAGNDVG
jgi:uncharacterized protein YecE (DUF72 family)